MQYFMNRVGQKIVRDSETPTNFCLKIMVFPKKEGLHLKSDLGSLLFVPKSQYSLIKKEKKGLHSK